MEMEMEMENNDPSQAMQRIHVKAKPKYVRLIQSVGNAC